MTDQTRTILHLIAAMIALPGMVLFVIPGLLIWHYGVEAPAVGDLRFWLAKPLLPGGLVLAGWTVASFFVHGKGTPAPWHPPKRLVVRGAYRFVRNPMLIGVLMMLAGEALLFNSAPIGLWGALFFALNTVYFIFFEEPGLEKRFGDDYRLYKANVGRWLPRLSPWTPPWEPDQDDQDGDANDTDPQAAHWKGYDENRNKT